MIPKHITSPRRPRFTALGLAFASLAFLALGASRVGATDETVSNAVQQSSGFEDGGIAPFYICTTRPPNYGIASDDIPGQMGSWSMKFHWKEESYNGTRVRKGAEACSSFLTYKEGWFGFSIYLPSPGYPEDKYAACAQIFQHSPEGEFGSWAALLLIENNELYIEHRIGRNGKKKELLAADIPRNTWVPIITHWVASNTTGGAIQVWYNGAPENSPTYSMTGIEFGFGVWDAATDSLTPGYDQVIKFGQYNHKDWTFTPGETRTSYYDNVCVLTGNPPGAWAKVNPLITNTMVTFASMAEHDGYVISSAEGSGVGGDRVHNANTTSSLRAGDTALNRQYRAIVSFDTSSIPDNAIIAWAKLKLKRGTVSGSSPFTTHGECYVDLKGGSGFGGSTTLNSSDYEAAPDIAQVAKLSDAPAYGDWSVGTINTAGLEAINLVGHTQFRISFTLDDDNDAGADFIGWYSGEAAEELRPVLEVAYYP